MSENSGEHHTASFRGPKAWIISTVVGLLIGAVLTVVLPPRYAQAPGHGPSIGDEAAPEKHEPAEESEPEARRHEFVVVPSAWSPPDPLPEAEHPGEAHGDVVEEAEPHEAHAPPPVIPLVLVAPFALLLLSIAIMPFVNERLWHNHFPDFAFLLGSIVVAYYLIAYDRPYEHGMSYGAYQMWHVGLEYYSFIALIGGLFVASGGILIDIRGRGTPLVNTALLAFGAVIANIVGTTGASVLLIRPFMRLNADRLRPIHVVMFIFIVSNCGGCLTPIGDPPLYLGFLKGVPFQWTLLHLWPMWAACVGCLLGVFFVVDSLIDRRLRSERAPEVPPAEAPDPLSVRVRGATGMIALALIIGGVFIDPLLKAAAPDVPALAPLVGWPVGPTFQILIAAAAYFVASKDIHEANAFNFFPVKEVGLLFIGIFATMTPALGYLAANADDFGLRSPTQFYFFTGVLSGVLDNAPTYLNFLQVAFGEVPINADTVREFLSADRGVRLLTSISLGAVFFGAMTYIGNGPNFMVKAIAESAGLRMPSFFGYVVRSVALLLPVLVVIWFIFVR